MPILKTEILGSIIEINYEEKELKQLLKLIESFKIRLNEFANNGKFSSNSIIFLSALKTEDSLEEMKKLLNETDKENIKFKKNITELKIIIEKSNKEIILLKEQLNLLDIENLKNNKDNSLILEEINLLENKINLLNKKISDSFK